MSRCVDGYDTLDIKRPLVVGVSEGSHETTRRSIDVNGNVQPGAFLKIVNYSWNKKLKSVSKPAKGDHTQIAHKLYILEVTGIGTSEDNHDADRVLVDIL